MKGKVRDKKITIYQQRNVAENGEMPKMKYVPIHSGRLWAYVRQTSADEVFNSAGEYSRESMVFEIAWKDDVKAVGHFVEYKGIFYDIKRVDTFEGYKGNITITADKMVSQPKPEEFMSY